LPEGPEPWPPLRHAWVEIDVAALERNFGALSRRVAPARVLPVVKADAYGHGQTIVARALEPLGPAGFGVALVEEGIGLRRAGVRSPVLVLSPAPPGADRALLDFDLTPVISAPDQLERVEARAAAAGRRLPVHLKFDTGMTRLGFPAAEAGRWLSRARESRWLDLVGVMSHLAEAEQPESDANRAQRAAFEGVLGLLERAERERLVVHLANSAAALQAPATRFDLVRLGLVLYGVGGPARELGLEPVMSVRAELAQVREVPAGTRAGYGGRWTAARPSRVGVVPVGYADGYPWRAEGRAEAILRGRRVPLAGAVSMDLILLDLTDVGGEVGEVVTLLGRDGEERVGASELAGRAGTLPYEVLCHFGLRLPRRAARGTARSAAAGRETVAG
jgi:alanine racemase